MTESFDQLVARVNGHAFLPPPDPTGVRAMAKQVKLAKGKEFQFNVSTGRDVTKYPWDEWFDGRLIMLERSSGAENDKGTIVDITEKRDYEVPTNGMPPKIHTAARRRYKVVQISRLDPDGNRLKDALIIRGRDMTPEERQEEDLLRAQEKEAAKAKKSSGVAAGANGAVSQHEEAPQEQVA